MLKIAADGTLIVEYAYDAWGNPTAAIPDGETSGESIGNIVLALFITAFNPLLYRGYLYTQVDDNFAYYLGSRFYLPSLHRFLNADVYEDTGTGAVGTNMFAYCNNNPVSYVDPDGHSVIQKVIIALVSCVFVYYAANELLCYNLYMWGINHHIKNYHYRFSKGSGNGLTSIIISRLKGSTIIKKILRELIGKIQSVYDTREYKKTYNGNLSFYSSDKNIDDLDLKLSIGGLAGNMTIAIKRKHVLLATNDNTKYTVTIELNDEPFDFHDWTVEGNHTDNPVARALNQFGYTTQNKDIFCPFIWGFTVSFDMKRGEIFL